MSADLVHQLRVLASFGLSVAALVAFCGILALELAGEMRMVNPVSRMLFVFAMLLGAATATFWAFGYIWGMVYG